MTDDEAIAQEIHEKALRYSTAKVYAVDNPWLSLPQKANIEAIYQLPFAVFSYCWLYLIYLNEGQLQLPDFGVAAAVSTVVGIVLLAAPKIFRPICFGVSILVLGSVSTLTHLGVAGFFLYRGWWIAALVAVVGSVGLLSIITPMMLLWSIGAGRMHPKYRLAKRLYGVVFPFEEPAE